jgi:glycosyltransferase involved in cell wall biosynthesis
VGGYRAGVAGMSESVVFVVPDTMGGMMNIVANLLAHRQPDAFAYHAVLTHNGLSTDARFGERLVADSQQLVEYRLPVENLHAVIRRLRTALPAGDGVLVTNDLLELAMASAADVGRTVMMLLHGDHDYYYDLAARHDEVIDLFICYGRTMYETLRARLPHRADTIVHLPYGIPLPERTRVPAAGPLRLLFAGRLDQSQKGVFDLPAIDEKLRTRGIDVSWTIVGAGPDEAVLRERWANNGRVQWMGAQTNARVLEIAAGQDVFVLPTRAEGLPVALVEAMAVGLVPVVSDIGGGVAEVMAPNRDGLMPAAGDIAGFADAVAALHADRARLERLSAAARQRVVQDFDIRTRVGAYQRLFADHRTYRRPRRGNVRVPYGSRLDQPWMPNAAVKAVRTVVRRVAGKAV